MTRSMPRIENEKGDTRQSWKGKNPLKTMSERQSFVTTPAAYIGERSVHGSEIAVDNKPLVRLGQAIRLRSRHSGVDMALPVWD